MTEKTRGERGAEERRLRAEEALKANLKRRKDQARARRAAVPETETLAESAGPKASEPDEA